MAIIYTLPSCTSCKKAKKWFQDNEITFEERNIETVPLRKQELMEILRLTDNGTGDIISTRSNIFQENKDRINQLSLQELFGFIQDNPGILRRPIIHDGKRLLVGYSESQIRRFLPRSVRFLQLYKARALIEL